MLGDIDPMHVHWCDPGATNRLPIVMEETEDNRALQFLIQKIAIDVQRGNAASVMVTIPSSQRLFLYPRYDD